MLGHTKKRRSLGTSAAQHTHQPACWSSKRCHGAKSAAPLCSHKPNSEEGLQLPSVRNIDLHASGAGRLVLLIWAMGNLAVADMFITTHRFMTPVLYITMSHGCDLQKLPMASSYMTFLMRQPFKNRVAHQKRGSRQMLVQASGP